MTDMQKKKVGLRKRSREMSAAACFLLAVLTAACGQVEEPVPVQLSSGDMEETYEEDGGADAEEAADANNGQQAADTENQPGEAAGVAELEGNVHSVSQGSFVVTRTEVWSEEGADVAVAAAPGDEEEEDLITVHVSQNCGWQYKTVKNGGIISHPERGWLMS